MPAGRYDKRAAIQSDQGTADDYGNVTPSWSTLATRWAMLEDTSGREVYRAQQVDPAVDAIVTLRDQYEGLSPEHRFVIDGRTLNIKAVLGKSDRTRKRGQVCHCMEEV